MEEVGLLTLFPSGGIKGTIEQKVNVKFDEIMTNLKESSVSVKACIHSIHFLILLTL